MRLSSSGNSVVARLQSSNAAPVASVNRMRTCAHQHCPQDVIQFLCREEKGSGLNANWEYWNS